MSVVDLFYPQTASKKDLTHPQGSAFYYLMKNGFILRVEEQFSLNSMPIMIQANLINPKSLEPMDQEQANYRVALFRDEILEMKEYCERVLGYSI